VVVVAAACQQSNKVSGVNVLGVGWDAWGMEGLAVIAKKFFD
jgi:hypothetical protein